jgi:hypothetical protein
MQLDTNDTESPEADTPRQEAAEAKMRARKIFDVMKTREKKFETGWWKLAEECSRIYSVNPENGKYEEEIPFNILYSNTEVLAPSLYSATPKPDIRPRFLNEMVNPIPEILDRFLRVAADPAAPGLDNFDASMRDCVLSALVPGSGYIRLRYRAELAFPLTYESGHYKTLIWAKATRWSKVPWIAFRHPMNRSAMFQQFEIPESAITKFKAQPGADEEQKDDCFVYEIWDKDEKKVYFVCEQWEDFLLDSSDDPLGLTGFYPIPGPLVLTKKPGDIEPTPLYKFYKNQAEELNRVTVRLNKILSAIRVRGGYSSMLGEDLKRILDSSETENALTPMTETGLLSQQGGFDKYIWLLPIEQFMKVAQQLYSARESIKQVIYEITGISDIIRGSSVASETATAQDLKNKWGTVRLREMQSTVANYARDLFRMSVDCGADHIPAAKWKEITQLPFPTKKEQTAAKKQLEYNQKTQQMQMPPTMPGQPQAPLTPPDPKLLAAAQGPTFEDILDSIKNDQHRSFVINIQTSSTIDLDTAQDKGDVSDFMNALGQVLPALQNLGALGPSGFEAAKAILTAVCQRYKFGLDIADVIDKLAPPPPAAAEPAPAPPPGPTPEELQLAQVKAQGAIQVAQSQRDLALEEVNTAKQLLAIKVQAAQLSLDEQRRKLAMQAAMPPKPAPSAKA